MVKIFRKILPFIVVVICGSLAHGSEVVFPATQIEKGRVSFNVYYDHSIDKLNLHRQSREEIGVGGLSYNSDVSSDYAIDGRSDSVLASIMINPHDGLYYWLKAGAGSYEVDIPSDTVKNTISGSNYGSIIGIGVRSCLLPDTIVTPALAVELGITRKQFNFDALKQGARQYHISDSLQLTEVQLAVNVSKKIQRLEPYGGVKIFRVYSDFRDNESLQKIDGYKDNVGIFAGARFQIYPRESLMMEGSILGDTRVTAGWNIEF